MNLFSFLMHPLSLHNASYFGLYLLLGGSGFYAPVPEELTLLTAGFLIAKGVMDWWIVLPVAIMGALVFDSVIYLLARTGAQYAVRLRERVVRAEKRYHWIFSPDHPLRVVFIFRFIVGLRIVGPLYAGFNRIPYPKFLLVTFANLIIFFPVVLIIGYVFHNSLPVLIGGFKALHNFILQGILVLLITVAGYIIFDCFSRRSK